MSQAITTTAHDKIRSWAEKRDGHPARVAETADGGGGILRIDFGEPEERLEPISWDRFFDIFEENDLAFLYQERTDSGDVSRFCKFIDREAA